MLLLSFLLSTTEQTVMSHVKCVTRPDGPGNMAADGPTFDQKHTFPVRSHV